MNEALLSIMMAYAKPGLSEIADPKERFEKSANATRNFWMGGDEEDWYRGAVAAFMASYMDEGNDVMVSRIKSTLDQLRNLNALLSGVPVDLEAMLKKHEEEEPLPLMAWWKDSNP